MLVITLFILFILLIMYGYRKGWREAVNESKVEETDLERRIREIVFEVLKEKEEREKKDAIKDDSTIEGKKKGSVKKEGDKKVIWKKF